MHMVSMRAEESVCTYQLRQFALLLILLLLLDPLQLL
jgi:hypothetical protein